MADKPMCKYGKRCYRKNPTHIAEYNHPEERSGDEASDVAAPVKKKAKHDTGIESNAIVTEASHSCGTQACSTSSDDPRRNATVESAVHKGMMRFTRARGIQPKYNASHVAIDIKEILARCKSTLKASAQFNYMIDIPWLMEQYPSSQRDCPLLIVHGDTGGRRLELEEQASCYSNVDLYQAKLPITFGTHHSKMMLLLYNGGMIVVIHTANLIALDWDQKTQGVWVSPLFPVVDKDVELTRSNTFQEDLLEYLAAYGDGSLNYWRRVIQRHDMSSARVRLIGSVPGRHVGSNKFRWGHMKLRKLLLNHGPCFSHVDSSWDVIGQFSSVGSLGPSPDKWLCGEWLKSLTACKGRTLSQESSQPNLKFIFPTVENVRTSLEGYNAGGSLPYSSSTAAKQPYLTDMLHQWKAEHCGRTRASPHVKSYTRVSPNCDRAAWLLLTSANLSKAAWGCFEKDNTQLMIRSYETGVLLLPRDQNAELESFRLITSNETDPSNSEHADSECVRLPYDLPLAKYATNDEPWLWDKAYTAKRDSQGGVWNPR